jgi:hypothetical protein
LKHGGLYRALGALVAAALAAGVAACGNDDGPLQTTAPAVTGASEAGAENAPGTDAPEDEPAPDPASDRAAISSAVETVLTGSTAVDACGDLVTDRYLARSYGGATGCKGAQGAAKPAEQVRVSRIVILPESVAQAAVVPRGGIYDGERLRAELVLDGGNWRLDSLHSNVPVGP